ncbi:hypothetical protein [Devosia psychrophila]|uniref:Uncharacterized protein n=2 Tax=Devosia psychrophila TaxID=728005 RepID=A0A1I1QR21_9HYPH|nr:hypothetical protein [Devosia psychrophila]SFD24452.1 hypothetical protein SAMN04488059_13214 [Devosia psychrophila]
MDKAVLTIVAGSAILLFGSTFVSAQAMPSKGEDLPAAIVRLMDKYRPALGITIITGEICDTVTERSLHEASESLGFLTPEIWTAGFGHPLAPKGALRAKFSRDAQFLRNQHLLIFVNDAYDYCEAKIENVSGFDF